MSKDADSGDNECILYCNTPVYRLIYVHCTLFLYTLVKIINNWITAALIRLILLILRSILYTVLYLVKNLATS